MKPLLKKSVKSVFSAKNIYIYIYLRLLNQNKIIETQEDLG